MLKKFLLQKKLNLSSYVAKASPPMVTMKTPITFASPRGGAIPCFLAAAHFPKDVQNHNTHHSIMKFWFKYNNEYIQYSNIQN